MRIKDILLKDSFFWFYVAIAVSYLHLVWLFYQGIAERTGFPIMFNPFNGILFLSILYAIGAAFLALRLKNILLLKVAVLNGFLFILVLLVFLKTFLLPFVGFFISDVTFTNAVISPFALNFQVYGKNYSLIHYTVFIVLISIVVNFLCFRFHRKQSM